MNDSEVVTGDNEVVQAIAEEGEKSGRSWRPLLFVLPLLLLLCAVTTVVDVWVTRGPDQARFITRNLECLACHTERIPQLDQAAVHNPFLLRECTVCHTPHGEEVERTTYEGASRTWQRVRTLAEWLPLKWFFDMYDSVTGVTGSDQGGDVVSTTTEQIKGAESNLVAPVDELCWICHGNLGDELGMSYTHAPFEGGHCTNCHDPHASDFRVLLVQDETDLCVTCHPVADEMGRDQLHPPFEGRFCTNCHNPHASEYRGILVDNQRDLCFTCHPSVAPLSLKAVQHNPFLYDNCTGCHEPHGSDSRPLLIDAQPDLCYMCHPGIETDFLKTSHHPVGTVALNCADCHDPHGADYPALLIARDNALCYTCHDTYPEQVTYDDSAHWDEKILCIRCHTPHGSDFAPILTNSNPDLCLECHPASKFDDTPASEHNNHPVRPSFFDVNAQRPLTCSSTCHDPHGTSHNYMLRYYDFPKDGNCLICHAVTPGDKVGVDF